MGKTENGKIEDKQENSTKDVSSTSNGSICGFESLHSLLQSSLSPNVFQVIFLLSIYMLVEFLVLINLYCCWIYDSENNFTFSGGVIVTKFCSISEEKIMNLCIEQKL